MKQFLYDLEWYFKEFLTKFFEMLAVIIGSICYVLYYGAIIFGDILSALPFKTTSIEILPEFT